MSIKKQKLTAGIKYLTQDLDKTQQYEVTSGHSRVFKCHLQIWKNDYFKKLHPQLDIQNLVNDFATNIELPGEIMGKKSSEIVMSNSRNFCIKMITDDDLVKFEEMLEDYAKFKEQMNEKKINLLVDIYRVFIVYSSDGTHHFDDVYILMPNIRAEFEKTIWVYDLKGHCQSRAVDLEDSKDFKYGKDENFLDSKELDLMKNSLSPEFKEQFIRNLQFHARFLKDLNILDYSLLLVFYNSEEQEHNKGAPEHLGIQLANNLWMKWAIIDYFQIYNHKKKMENKFKSLFRKDVSSVEPEVYYKRFLAFFTKHLLDREDE